MSGSLVYVYVTMCGGGSGGGGQSVGPVLCGASVPVLLRKLEFPVKLPVMVIQYPYLSGLTGKCLRLLVRLQVLRKAASFYIV